MDVEPPHAVNVEPPHADPGTVDVARLAAALRGDKLINEVEIIPGPGTTITVLIVPQGFRPGHVLRARVMRLAPDAGHRLQVALLRAIPRHPDGRLDREGAFAETRRPGALYRYEPPATEAERAVVALVREVLPGVQVSVTDGFAALGGDSLATLELTGLINERLGVDVDPLRVFGAESLRELAATLAAALAAPGVA
jgi:acyl carrier protein